MLTVAATWTAVVLGLGVLLMMAVGPAVAELDGRLAERRHHGPARGRSRSVVGEWRIRPVLLGKSAIHPKPGRAA